MMEYGLIGERLSHSFSKEIHTQLCRYDYDICEVSADEIDRFMTERKFRGINVTIPYKETVIPYLNGISEEARTIGAVNTVINRDGLLYGYNTDFAGMTALINRAGIDLVDKKVAILGSGGTSKTARAVAKSFGCGQLVLVSRSGGDGYVTYDELYSDHGDVEIIINTTPCGMHPNVDTVAVDIDRFSALCGVIDAVYNPLRSRLVCNAQRRGIRASGGLYMLVAQAVAAAEIFTGGESIPSEKVEAVYESILRQKENIVLIGMPGCGKSTVGRMLSQRLGLPLTDTDAEIERSHGDIPSIFNDRGEKGFRDIEQGVIDEVARSGGRIISTGGGAILREENVLRLMGNGRLVFLDRPLEKIAATKSRPLSSDRETLKKRFEERYGRYLSCCDIHIKSDSTPERTVEDVLEAL